MGHVGSVCLSKELALKCWVRRPRACCQQPRREAAQTHRNPERPRTRGGARLENQVRASTGAGGWGQETEPGLCGDGEEGRADSIHPGPPSLPPSFLPGQELPGCQHPGRVRSALVVAPGCPPAAPTGPGHGRAAACMSSVQCCWQRLPLGGLPPAPAERPWGLSGGGATPGTCRAAVGPRAAPRCRAGRGESQPPLQTGAGYKSKQRKPSIPGSRNTEPAPPHVEHLRLSLCSLPAFCRQPQGTASAAPSLRVPLTGLVLASLL